MLASGILIALWFSVGVVVPAAMAPDRPTVDSAQLIIVTENSDPSLKALVLDKSLPAMGEQVLPDAPMLDGMLSLLGLQEEVERSVRLYPEEITKPSLDWPKWKRATSRCHLSRQCRPVRSRKWRRRPHWNGK